MVTPTRLFPDEQMETFKFAEMIDNKKEEEQKQYQLELKNYED